MASRLRLCSVLLAILAAIGCGGSSVSNPARGQLPTKAAFLAAANEICAEANAAFRTLYREIGDPGSLGNPRTRDALAAAVKQAAAIQARRLDELKALPRPHDDRKLLARILAQLNETVSLARAGTGAIERRDKAEFDKLNSEYRRLIDAVRSDMVDYGFADECTGTP